MLAGLVASKADRPLLLADLDERFEVLGRERGERAARRWYWSQAVRGVAAAVRPDANLLRRSSWTGTAGDVRQAMRSLRRRPLFTSGVVGTLALGLASASLVLTVAWSVWLSPMPFPDPDGIVRLFELEAPEAPRSTSVVGAPLEGERVRWRLSPPLLEDLRAMEWETVSAVAGVSANVRDWEREEGTTRVTALAVSPEAFDILGWTPVVGRGLSDDRDANEVVLTADFWERVFGADPTVVGRVDLDLGGGPARVVGVVDLPVGYPDRADLVTRLAFEPSQLTEGMRGARYLDVIARVRPGHTVLEASSEMDRIMGEMGRRHAIHVGAGGEAARLTDELVRPYRGVLALLLAAGCAFLVLAVVNVIGLVASRTLETARARAVRLALGASERRLLRSTILEGCILGVAAALAATAGSRLAVGPLRALIPPDVPRVENVDVGAGMVLGIATAALLAGAAIGAVGHLLSRKVAGPGSRSGAGSKGDSRARSAVVIAQVALTVLLATAGAGVLRHVVKLRAVDLGFDPTGVSSTQVVLTGQRYPTPEARLTFWRSILEGLEGRGLEVAVGTSPPMARVNMPWGYRRDAAADQAFAQYHIVSSGYFELFDIRTVEGRTFTDDDVAGGEPVVVVNDVLAGVVFPGESAIGRTIEVIGVPKTIVGVVGRVRHFGPERDAPEEIYAPFAQDPWPHAQVLVRGVPSVVAPIVADVSDGVDPWLGLPPVEAYARFVSDWYASLRLQLVIVGLLALVGTTLAALGLYALVAYRVGMRRREIGLRMALGASAGRTFRSVVREALELAVTGVGLGVVAWYAVAPLAARTPLEGLGGDPVTPALVAIVVVLVAVVASVVPARRGVRVDPAITLQTE